MKQKKIQNATCLNWFNYKEKRIIKIPNQQFKYPTKKKMLESGGFGGKFKKT